MDIQRLYKFIVMEHVNSPINKDETLNDDNSFRVNNDSCGDRLYLKLIIEDNKIVDVKWNGTGCSLSMSVCSIMSKWLLNETLKDAQYKLAQFEKLVLNEDYDKNLDFDELLVMENQLPARYKCATLFKQGAEKVIENWKENNGN